MELTGSSSGGAFPECVFEGDFSQVLSHFLCFVCVWKERRMQWENWSQSQSKMHLDLLKWGGQDTSEQFTQVRFAFVKRSFPIFVADAHLSPISHEILRKREEFTLMGTTYKIRKVSTRGHTYLSHLVLAPEAGIMQWCVPVFIGCICICFALDQLKVKAKNKGLYKKQGWSHHVWAVYRASVNAANRNHGVSSRLWTHTRGTETCLTLNSIAAWRPF